MARAFKRDILERRRAKYGYIFCAPFILGAVLAVIYPIAQSVIFSVSELIPQTIGYKLEPVWFRHYVSLFTEDPVFRQELLYTLRDTLLNVPVVVIFSFFLACVLNSKFKGRGAARTILFLPLILFSYVVMHLMAGDVVSGSLESKSAYRVDGYFAGAFAEFLETVGVGQTISDLLASSVNNIGNLLAMSVIPTIILLAGLQSINRGVYEAAFVEGATSWEVLWKVSLPIVSPMILVSVVYCVIDSFTGYGNVVIERIREECFTNYNFGLGSAMAWTYLLIVIAVVGLAYTLINRFVSYDT